MLVLILKVLRLNVGINDIDIQVLLETNGKIHRLKILRTQLLRPLVCFRIMYIMLNKVYLITLFFNTHWLLLFSLPKSLLPLLL